jgi:23S rRNA (pseudouridine1915-N3)-methyltransferase
MQITLLCIGKTDQSYLKEGIALYQKRLQHYTPFEWLEIPVQKKWGSLPALLQKQKEAEVIIPYMNKYDYSILLDERGKSLGSTDFAAFIQQHLNRSAKSMLFIVGGPWGFSQQIYDLAQGTLSLSPMTFSHQMVRLFFVEQLYRAMTILRGESYHNE